MDFVKSSSIHFAIFFLNTFFCYFKTTPGGVRNYNWIWQGNEFPHPKKKELPNLLRKLNHCSLQEPSSHRTSWRNYRRIWFALIRQELASHFHWNASECWWLFESILWLKVIPEFPSRLSIKWSKPSTAPVCHGSQSKELLVPVETLPHCLTWPSAW